MPFGLCNAPNTFQALMNSIFQPFLCQFVLVFFDDILIYSANWKSHLQHLELMFHKLHENHFFVKAQNCSFGQNSVSYLGHVISRQGVSVETQKIQSILHWPTPNLCKLLEGF